MKLEDWKRRPLVIWKGALVQRGVAGCAALCTMCVHPIEKVEKLIATRHLTPRIENLWNLRGETACRIQKFSHPAPGAHVPQCRYHTTMQLRLLVRLRALALSAYSI